MSRKLFAEAFGTFWLVFGGCGSAIFAAAFPQLGIGFTGVSLAFGLTVLTMAYAVGPISGGHFNPEKKMHGLENPDGHHAGDMLNFTVDAKGKSKATVANTSVNLNADEFSLFRDGGTAIVIHAKADDMKTDPAGNAGDRIACGVVQKPTK